MAGAFRNNLIARGAGHVPGLRHIPIFKLLVLGEIALLAHDHYKRLEPAERRRLGELLRQARGRAGNLSQTERDELVRLVAKTEPRLFAGMSADKLSPIPLPKRFVHGAKKK